MHVRTLICSSVFVLAWSLRAAPAHAEGPVNPEPDAATDVAKPKPYFVGFSVGAAYASINHPLLVNDAFATVALGLHAGYAVNDRFALGVELSSFEKTVERRSPIDPFAPAEYLQPMAGCNKCKAPPDGGWVSKTTAFFGTIGPRAEYTPFGRDGLFVSASGGVAILLGIDTQFGGGVGGRVGYRMRIAKILTFSLEGGVQSQFYNEGRAFFPYASLMMRPYF